MEPGVDGGGGDSGGGVGGDSAGLELSDAPLSEDDAAGGADDSGEDEPGFSSSALSSRALSWCSSTSSLAASSAAFGSASSPVFGFTQRGESKERDGRAKTGEDSENDRASRVSRWLRRHKTTRRPASKTGTGRLEHAGSLADEVRRPWPNQFMGETYENPRVVWQTFDLSRKTVKWWRCL